MGIELYIRTQDLPHSKHREGLWIISDPAWKAKSLWPTNSAPTSLKVRVPLSASIPWVWTRGREVCMSGNYRAWRRFRAQLEFSQESNDRL
jgi:hypothetical protein